MRRMQFVRGTWRSIVTAVVCRHAELAEFARDGHVQSSLQEVLLYYIHGKTDRATFVASVVQTALAQIL